MNLFLIIYLIGVLAVLIAVPYVILKSLKYLTVIMIFGTIALSMFSWITILLGTLCMYGDSVVYRKK